MTATERVAELENDLRIANETTLELLHRVARAETEVARLRAGLRSVLDLAEIASGTPLVTIDGLPSGAAKGSPESRSLRHTASNTGSSHSRSSAIDEGMPQPERFGTERTS